MVRDFEAEDPGVGRVDDSGPVDDPSITKNVLDEVPARDTGPSPIFTRCVSWSVGSNRLFLDATDEAEAGAFRLGKFSVMWA